MSTISSPGTVTGLAEPGVGASPAAGAGDPLRLVRRTGLVLLGLQLVAMLAFSTVEYHRYALTKDFGAYSQAWWAIAHGHLDPFSTVFGTQFWRNNSDFAMWPLALLYYVFPHPIDLLWVQDVVVVATELVALDWVLRVVERSPGALTDRAKAALGIGAAVVLAANPWAWETIAFDVHFEPFAAFFAVLAGRDLWAGRSRRLLAWVPLTLLCESLGGLYLVGVGLSGVLGARATRRTGLVVALVGLAWITLLTAAGGVGLGGHGIANWYGYLVGPHRGHVGLFDLVVGMVRHPSAMAHMIATRWTTLLAFLLPVGLVGVASPWAIGMSAVVFVPAMLNADPNFFRAVQSFQVWPALPFIVVASVMVVSRLFQGGPRSRRAAAAVGAAWLTLVCVFAIGDLPSVPGYWLAVDPAGAAQLQRIDKRIPERAELIVSQGVVGRLAERSSVYAFAGFERTFPVERRHVAFVITPSEGVGEVTAREARAAIAYVHDTLGARVVMARDGVHVLEWSPPVGTRRVSLP